MTPVTDPTLGAAAEAFTREMLHLAGYSERTVESYGRDLQGLFAFLSRTTGRPACLADLDTAHLRLWLAGQHAAGAKPRSVLRRRSAVRRFTRYLTRENLLADDPAAHLPAPKAGRPLPRVGR